MPQTIVKSVTVNEKPFDVVLWFQDDPNEVEWYDVVDSQGNVLNGNALYEIPTEREIEELVYLAKR